ncbi:unnamed protein product [Urochloa decumbens]|uniref:Uncharacterized protein n=1 Tax=Urochloa decumbens TaxID=240449 RepID=A0ABC9B9E8_9POAL
MPRPTPPAYVRMPGRPKTERRREPGEAPKGTKLSRVGMKMKCSLCQKTTHNSRKCPRNPEAGKKKNAYIKRDATRKRKASEAAISNTGGTMGTQQSVTSQGPTARPRTGPSATSGAGPSVGQSSNTQQGSSSQLPKMTTHRNTSRLAYLMFGDNY